MKNKSTMSVLIAVGVAALIGGVLLLSGSQKDSSGSSSNSNADSSSNADSAVGSNNSNADTVSKADSDVQSGNYVTVADYNADPGKYADTKKVYFFHAAWCPTCQGIDKEIKADGSRIPAGVTIIKTDFDTQLELRKKYGVTTQFTFVQVDNNGNEQSQWTASDLQEVIDGIES